MLENELRNVNDDVGDLNGMSYVGKYKVYPNL